MSYDNYETIAIEQRESGIMIITLNQPENLNAVSVKMLQELTNCWSQLRTDMDTRVVILNGAGDRGFCAGLSFKDSLPPEQMKSPPHLFTWLTQLSELQLAMRKIPQPILCVIHGAASGLGFTFAMASDIRIISPDARFSASFINLGVGGADMGSSYFLPRLLGSARTYDMLLTGRFMDAQEAMSLGFASYCVEREELMNTALQIASNIASKDPLAIRLTKKAINFNIDCEGLEAALNMENRNQLIMLQYNMAKVPK
jgi:enoyl-CoA hydratase/carnithine racemase